MRFSDLLGGPDDGDESPAGSTGSAGSDPTGSSGSLGAPPTAPEVDDDIARWFAPEAPAGGTFGATANPLDPPADPPTPARALAAATGAADAEDTAAGEPQRAREAATGVARDDLMPVRPAHHGRRRR